MPLARFGVRALQAALGLGRAWFARERAHALFAGVFAQTLEPLIVRQLRALV